MWLIRSAVILVGVIAFLWVGMTNAGERVNFMFFTKSYADLSLNLLIMMVFAAGMVFSFLIFALSEFQLRNTINRQQRELSALRNLPLEDSEDAGTPAGV